MSDEEKDKAIQDKPPHPLFVVYMDDSGKNANYLLIGSLWFLVAGYQIKLLSNEIRKLRELYKFEGEFHFKEMRPDDLPLYKELISIFLQHANAVSFKLISIPRSGIGKIQDAMEDLYYHLLIKGVEHEDESGRAPLPRSLQVWKDAEESGADKLLLANLEDKLKQASKSVYKDRLTIEKLFAVDSEHNYFIQVADLLTSSANRVLNRSGEKYNHKDEFAEFLLKSLGIDLSLKPNAQLTDKSIYISL